MDKSFRFALSVIALCRHLRDCREYDLASQLLRSGTSIGANIEEANAGVSKPDFIAKMAIASKEARESRYWLHLLKASGLLPQASDGLLQEITEIISLLTAIVKTAQNNPGRRGI